MSQTPDVAVARTLRRVAVLGAGTMGSGIAAQAANAGLSVLMLDVDRAAAQRGRESLATRRPDPLMEPAALDRIEVGGFDTDLGRLADVDWIVEVVVEQLPIKRALYQRVEAVRRPGSIISSNTSGLRLAELTEGLPASFAQDFLITHFFNPPRYMGLVELVPGPATRADVVADMAHFLTVSLGKQVVRAKDTPSFIGNRVGVVAIMAGVHAALEQGLSPEQADAVAGRPMGFPGTGVFGLIDLIGLDVLADVCKNMRGQLAPGDPAQALLELPAPMPAMLERGLLGRKRGAGFYRETRTDAGKRREVLDFASGEYRPQQAVDPQWLGNRKLPELVAGTDPAGRYAWAFLRTALGYAAQTLPEIAEDIAAVDCAMREGYSWRWGPFELLDQLGAGAFAQRLVAEGLPVPAILREVVAAGGRFYRPGGEQGEFFSGAGSYLPLPADPDAWQVAQLRRRGAPIQQNASGTLWDAGDGVALLEFHTKMNALDEHSVAALEFAAQRTARDFRALVIGSDAAHFCAGANLKRMLEAARSGDLAFLERFIGGLQNVLMALKYAPYPVVAAARGLALGGGCEVLLHCAAVQAHSEHNAGLVERNVGLLPAGGGCKEMALRHGADAGLATAFDLVVGAVVSGSAAQARTMRVLNERSGITMNTRRVIADAKRLALELAPGYRAPVRASFVAPGAPGAKALLGRLAARVTDGTVSAYDAVIAGHIATVMTGGNVAPGTVLDEQALLDLERAHFVELISQPLSQARIEHMLATGKALRN